MNDETVSCRTCGGELVWLPGNLAIGKHPWRHRPGHLPDVPHKPAPPEEAAQPR